MRRVVLLAWCLAECGRAHSNPNVTMTSQAFIVSAYLAVAGDAGVCALATRQARLPETRELGAAVHRTFTSMRNDLAAVAQRRRLPLPKGIEEKKEALADNLATLPGQRFDEGYALAMLQDTRSLLQTFDAAAALPDPDVHNIVNKYRAQLQDEQRTSSRLLTRLGGPPWPAFTP